MLAARVKRAAMGVANHEGGGWIVVGIEENAGKTFNLTGVPAQHLDTWNHDDVSAMINGSVEPHIVLETEFVVHNGRTFVVIRIYQFVDVPVICTATGPTVPGEKAPIHQKDVCYARTTRKPETINVLADRTAWRTLMALVHAFENRLAVDAEAARAEAATFGFLRINNLDPRPFEDPSTGGWDFVCRGGRPDQIAVEVTSIKRHVVAEASSLPDPLPPNQIVSFQQITWELVNSAIDEVPQLSKAQMPRLLVIATEHHEAALLMNARSASELMMGTTKIKLPLGVENSNPYNCTTFVNAVFCKLGSAGVQRKRESISAILLMGISASASHVIGLLHPEPIYEFSRDLLPRVHFVRFRSWPLVDGRLELEWVGPDPRPTPYSHLPIHLTDDELRSES